MIRLLPRTPRGTWLLAGAVWLGGVGALWWALPYRPRAAWATEEPAVVHGFIPDTMVLLTSSPSSPNDLGRPVEPMLGPVLARDAATGLVREWLSGGQRLTLVDPGVDGRHVLIGRMVDGCARLFLHDATSGAVVAELPRGALGNAGRIEEPLGGHEQFAAFRPDGQQIVYAEGCGLRRWLRVWDVEARQEVAVLRDAGQPVAWSPDGRLLEYGVRNDNPWSVRSVRVWDVKAGQTWALGTTFSSGTSPAQLVFSPSGKTVVAARVLLTDVPPGPLFVHRAAIGWDVATGAQVFDVSETGVAFPPESPWFVSIENSGPWGTSWGSVVRRRNYDTGAECGEVTLMPKGQMTWSNGRLHFGVARQENPVLEWLAGHVFGRPPGEFTSFRPQFWDAKTGERRYWLPMAINPYFNERSKSSWSRNGELFAIAGETTLAVWDIPPLKPLSWYAAGAALLAFPVFVVALRRVRRLRREAAV